MKQAMLTLLVFHCLQNGVAGAQSLTENTLYANADNIFSLSQRLPEYDVFTDPPPHHHYRHYRRAAHLRRPAATRNIIGAAIGIALIEDLIGVHASLDYDRFLLSNRLLSLHFSGTYATGENPLIAGGSEDYTANGHCIYAASGVRFHSQMATTRAVDFYAGPSLLLGGGYYRQYYSGYHTGGQWHANQSNFTLTGAALDLGLTQYPKNKPNGFVGFDTRVGYIFNWAGQTTYMVQFGFHFGGTF